VTIPPFLVTTTVIVSMTVTVGRGALTVEYLVTVGVIVNFSVSNYQQFISNEDNLLQL
jgi:hypothetical protein